MAILSSRRRLVLDLFLSLSSRRGSCSCQSSGPPAASQPGPLAPPRQAGADETQGGAGERLIAEVAPPRRPYPRPRVLAVTLGTSSSGHLGRSASWPEEG